MIIKMKISDGWYFIADLENVEKYPYNSSEGKVAEDEFDEFYRGFGDKEVFPSSAFIRCRRYNGKVVGLISNHYVYLLNDNGKTIERLN